MISALTIRGFVWLGAKTLRPVRASWEPAEQLTALTVEAVRLRCPALASLTFHSCTIDVTRVRLSVDEFYTGWLYWITGFLGYIKLSQNTKSYRKESTTLTIQPCPCVWQKVAAPPRSRRFFFTRLTWQHLSTWWG